MTESNNLERPYAAMITKDIIEIIPQHYIEEAPTKEQIGKLVNILVTENEHPLVKWVTIKTWEEVTAQYIESQKEKAKEQFAKDFKGVTNAEAYGVKFQLRSKAAQERVKNFLYSAAVTELEDEYARKKQELDDLKELIIQTKFQEINNDTAIVLVDEYGVSNYTLVTSLRRK